MTNWNISLEPWIIEDGNYPNFKVGESKEFALEFTLQTDPKIISSNAVSAKLIKDNLYSVLAKVIYIDERIWVIDFGLLAYADITIPKGIRVGSNISVNIGISIDYYLYFEFLCKNQNIPPMIYTWNIQKIHLLSFDHRQTITHVEPDWAFVKRLEALNPVMKSTEEINATDILHDKGQCYILECQKVNIPTRRSISATY